MRILVFNCGSSSLNFRVFRAAGDDTFEVECRGKAHRVGVTGTEPSFFEHGRGQTTAKITVPIPDHQRAAQLALEMLRERDISIDIVGHRFVHGGRFRSSTLLTPEVEDEVDACLDLAPLHNPASMSVVEQCHQLLPDVPQYLTFDTAFHATLPPQSRTYALPRALCQRHGLYRIGFHGISYQYVCGELARFLNRPLDGISVIACHLGTGGSSVTGIKDGRCMCTSMGYSPLSGLIMSTRPGDVDPLLAPLLERRLGHDSRTISQIYNKESGLLGLSGFSSDMRDIVTRMEGGHDRATLAFQAYTLRLAKYVGASAAVMGGLDVLAFTDDVGVGCWQVRQATCRRLGWAGVEIDDAVNQSAPIDTLSTLSPVAARVLTVALPTDEERLIALEGLRLWKETIRAVD